jgi:hypothetical protein
MKVLDQGKWQNPWTAEVICQQKQCGAKLLIEENDVKAPDYSVSFTYTCPVCGAVNYLNENDISLRVTKKAAKGRKPPNCSSWGRD